MYTKKQVESLFGSKAVEYLQRKNTGGTSSSKGIKYEDIFAVYQLALLSRCVIECDKEIYLSSQCFAFVDDLVIDCKNEIALRHYQLKNSSSVTWGEGEKSICDDFDKQYQLNKLISRESELLLVLSSEELKEKLSKEIPVNIQNYSKVIYFYYDDSLLKIIGKEPDFKRSIEYLCAFDNPAPDKLECVASVLLGAWISSNKSTALVMDILRKAQQYIPSYIRCFQSNLQLDPEVERILSNIEDFTYEVTKGFLCWDFQNGLEEGILSYSLESDKFQKFQELLKKNCPNSFDELEVFLI